MWGAGAGDPVALLNPGSGARPPVILSVACLFPRKFPIASRTGARPFIFARVSAGSATERSPRIHRTPSERSLTQPANAGRVDRLNSSVESLLTTGDALL